MRHRGVRSNRSIDRPVARAAGASKKARRLQQRPADTSTMRPPPPVIPIDPTCQCRRRTLERRGGGLLDGLLRRRRGRARVHLVVGRHRSHAQRALWGVWWIDAKGVGEPAASRGRSRVAGPPACLRPSPANSIAGLFWRARLLRLQLKPTRRERRSRACVGHLSSGSHHHDA